MFLKWSKGLICKPQILFMSSISNRLYFIIFDIMNSLSMISPNNAWHNTIDLNDEGALQQEEGRIDEDLKITATFSPFAGYQSIYLMEQRQEEEEQQEEDQEEDDQDIQQYMDDLQVPDQI